MEFCKSDSFTLGNLLKRCLEDQEVFIYDKMGRLIFGGLISSVNNDLKQYGIVHMDFCGAIIWIDVENYVLTFQ